MPNAVEYIINVAGNAERKLSSLEKAFGKVDTAASSAGKKVSGLDKLKGSLMGLTDSVPGIAALANPVGLAAAGVVAVGAAAVYATNKAMAFEAGMAKANGTLQKSPEELAKIRNQLLDLGRNSTTELGQIPDAYNQIVSGVGDAKLAMDIMKASLKGAEAGFADINRVGNAAVNVLNSVGSANTNANEVMDVLFATVNKGKGEFQDFANYLPKVIPASNNLGISFKETAGAFAFLTANGLSAEQSTTALQNAMKALGTGRVRDNMKGLGVEVFDAKGKIRSLTDVSSDLNKKLNGLTDKQRTKVLESMGFDQEASLAFSKFAQQPKLLKESIDATVNSQGAMQKTLNASANPMHTMKKLGNQFEGVMTKLGYAILPTVSRVLGGTLNFVDRMISGVQNLWNNSIIFRGVIQGLLLPFKALWFMAETAYTLIGSVFTGIGKGISWVKGMLKGNSITAMLFDGLATHWAIFKNIISNVVESAGLAAKAINAAAGGNFTDASKFAGKAKDALLQTVDPKERAAMDKIKSLAGQGGDFNKIMQEQQAKLLASGSDASAVFGGPDKGTLDYLKGLDNKEKAQGDRVAGGGSRPVNINIRIEKLNEGGISVHSATLREGEQEIEQRMLDLFLRVVNSANNVALG